MRLTFLDAISYYKTVDDKESILFLEYVLKKYFNDKKIFMKLDEAQPYLEDGDLDRFVVICNTYEADLNRSA